MRQPNRAIPSINRPVEVLCQGSYNRQALDVTSTLPLSFSLSNLRPLVFNLAPLRQLMTEDGGLEALVRILCKVRRPDDPLEGIVRRHALECISQFGLRGPESIRLRAAEANVVPALITILECFWRAMEPEIRESILAELNSNDLKVQQRQEQRPTIQEPRPCRATTRRRAVTLASLGPHPVIEGLEGLQIRIPQDRSPLSRVPPVTSQVAAIPLQRASEAGQTDANVTDDVTAERMDVDSGSGNITGEDEVVVEDPMTDWTEGLRSPPPQTSLTQTISPTRMEVDNEPQQMSQQPSIAHIPQPPNAPIIPYAVPPSFTPTRNPSSHQHQPSRSTPSRISKLYTRHNDDWHIPRQDDMLACLQTLAYLSKYPKFRSYFIDIHFVPSLLFKWVTPEDYIPPLPSYDKNHMEDSENTERECNKVNVYEIVERFTFAGYHPEEIRHWASLVMRHYGRKDEICRRRCGNLKCQMIEADDRKFVCCPNCRRARYCSLACFERALPGHTQWCENRIREKERRAQAAEAAAALAQAQAALLAPDMGNETLIARPESRSVTVGHENGGLPNVNAPEGYA